MQQDIVADDSQWPMTLSGGDMIMSKFHKKSRQDSITNFYLLRQPLFIHGSWISRYKYMESKHDGINNTNLFILKMKQALIVVDVQNDYFPGGNLPTDHPVETAQAVAQLITKFRQESKEVVFAQHIATEETYKVLPIMKDGSKGAEIHDLVRPLPTEKVVRKHEASSFVRTDLDAYLKSKDIDTVVVVGMMIHNCVNATVYDANANGYQCFVVDEAVNTFDQKLYGKVIPAKQIKESFLTGIQFAMAKVVRLNDALNDKYY